MIIPSPPNQFLRMKKLHLYLCALVALSIIVFYFILFNPGKKVNSADTFGLILEAIVPVFAVISVFIGNFMLKRELKTLSDKSSLNQKLEVYQKGSLIKWSNILGSVFLAIVAYYLTGRNNFILYALMLGVFLIYLRPLKSRIKEELKLNEEEVIELNKE
jgi:hypothetical protein